MTDLNRVIRVIDWLIFSKRVKSRRELAKKLDYTESSLSQILNQKVPLSESFIKKLATADDAISLGWLLTGEGDMLKPTSNTYSKNIANTRGSGNQITQMSDLVIGGGISNIGNRNNRDTSQNELEKRYKARIAEIEEGCAIRISEMEKKCEALLAAKDEIINELKLQNERANKTIEILCDRR